MVKNSKSYSRVESNSGIISNASTISSLRAKRSNLTQSGVILNAVKNLILLLCTLHLALSTSYADTTWVSGAVSGEWTRDGNPYIVVDSTWVPEGERLTLTAGVEAFFDEGQGLYVFGDFRPIGARNDSVMIRIREDAEHWMGVRFYGRNSATLTYSSIIVPDTAIILDDRYTFTVSNSTIIGQTRGLRGLNEDFDPPRLILTFSHSTYAGGTIMWIREGIVRAEYSLFDFSDGEMSNPDQPGFQFEGGSLFLSHCTVYGKAASGVNQCSIEDSRIFYTRFGVPTFAAITGPNGRLLRSFVEGHVSAYGGVIDSPTLIEDNLIMGDFGGEGCWDLSVLNCRVGGSFSLANSRTVLVRNTQIRRSMGVWDEIHDVWIDSCLIGYEQWGEGSDNFYIRSKVKVTNSYLKIGLDIFEDAEIIFDHNTFAFDSLPRGAEVITNLFSTQFVLTNNIFVNYGQPGPFCWTLNDEALLPEFRYNCLYGFSRFMDYPDTNVVPDETNIIADPLLEFWGFGPLLTSDSPCIDRGDPEFALDPDGTRSDIGAHYYHQNDEVQLEGAIPSAFGLMAFPNPFNSMLTIQYGLDKSAPTRLGIYDVNGREVFFAVTDPNSSGKITPPLNKQDQPNSFATPYHGVAPAIAGGDFRTLVWDASASPAGVYFVKVQAGGKALTTKKVVLMR